LPALLIKIEAALGADFTVGPSSWPWTDITAYWLKADDLTIQRGVQNEFDTFQASRITFTLNNSDGRFTTTNPAGAWYGTWGLNTPIRVSINATGSYVSRGICFVSQINHAWPLVKETLAVVRITADGPIRRINAGRPLRSFLYRTSRGGATGPIEYWPMEEAAGTVQFSSAVGGLPLSTQGSLTAGSFSGFPGSEPIAVVPVNTSFAATVRPYTSPSPNQWLWQFVMYLPNVVGGTVPFVYMYSTGTVQLWRFTLAPGAPDTILLQGYNSAGTEVLGAAPTSFINNNTGAEAYNQPAGLQLIVAQNGSNIDWTYYVYTNQGGVGAGGSVAGTLGNTTKFAFGAGALLADAAVGHLAAVIDGIGLSNQNLTGAAGDEAWSRWLTLVNTVPGAIGDGAGPVAVNTVLGEEQSGDTGTLLRQIIEADLGVGYERTDSHIYLQPRYNLYNQAVALSLDFDQHHVALPWLPVEDDQKLRNDWTVSRFGGGTARYTLPKVDPTSVDFDPTVAVYEDQATVNLFADSDLPFHAQWRVHLGNAATQRYPQLSINLARNPSLAAAWLSTDIGERIQIANPLQQLPPDPLDLLLVGYIETFYLHGTAWKADLNCVDYRPYEVFKIEDTRLGRLDSADSTLLAAATSSATTLRIWTDTTLGPLWTTTTGYDLEIAGERITPTAVSSSAISFVTAGTATHGNNASVVPGMPASIQAGDALFVLAAIRNSGTGTVNTPAGYTHLFEADSMALFGKIYDGSESAPTISFTNGVANATTSAQMAAFRNCSLEVCNFATQSNASAQNIAYPTMGSDRWNSLFLVLGWKQDDWTSVAALGGMNEIGEPSSTTGDDQGLVWDYLIQGATGNQEIAAGSFVVTGGASAISRGAVVSIAGDVQTFTVTRSVNSVAKAQVAGTPVHVWRTGYAAL